MVSRAAPALTKTGFRRDVRLFLTILVGILITLILALVILLGYAATELNRSAEASARTRTRAAAALIEASGSRDSTLASYLVFLRSELNIDAIAFVPKEGNTVTSGEGNGLHRVEQRVSSGTVLAYFDLSGAERMRRTFLLTTLISAAATMAGAILLFLYLPKITHTREQELERLHAEQKSRADDLERVSNALTRSLTSGFVAIDPAERIVDANAAAREILQLGGDDVAGRNIAEAFGENEFTRTLERVARQHTTVSRAEIDTLSRTIGLTTVPLVGGEQQYLGMIALFTDLTPIRRLEELLRESQNLADLGEISAGIAHEFRNSLSTILGYLRLARRGSDVPAATLASMEKAEHEATTLAQAVDALLAFARPMKLERHSVDLYEIACEVAERVTPEDVRVTCEGERAVIDGDAALLRTAIENLVRNAIDSVRQKGSGLVAIRVAATPHPSVQVEDSGIGVDPAEVATLLLPFQSRKPDGHGLGLPLAKKIVFLHGGTLRLTGVPDKGATATIDFL